MLIPVEKIDEVRNSVNIIDIISQSVRLKKTGANFTGLCPFHSEKTPSFVVSPHKQIYKCFGCQASGNVFKFLTEYKKISFYEAVLELAGISGITIEVEKNKFKAQETSRTEKMYDINELIASFYQDILISQSQGRQALSYLTNRGIKNETIKTFKLGYSPNRELINKFIENKYIDYDLAIELGIIGKNDNNQTYDKYSQRLIFPLFSPNGRIIGFAGRVLSAEANIAKYLNSPESLIYNKRNTLYGLFFAKDEIRKKDHVFVVEGYMDLITLFQNGIRNVVAVGGTSLTEEQATLLSRFTKTIYLNFDSDSAGIKASLRSIETLLKKDFGIRVITLPENEDPDSFVKKNGSHAFLENVKYATDFLDFMVATFEKEGKLSDPNSLTDSLKEISKAISVIPDPLKREVFIKTIADKYDIRFKLLLDTVNSFAENAQNNYSNYSTSSPTNQQSQSFGIKQGRTDSSNAQQDAEIKKSFYYEYDIIRFLLEGRKNISDVIFKSLDANNFSTNEVQIIYQKLKDIFEEYKTTAISSVIDLIEDEKIANLLIDLSLEKYKISNKWTEMYEEDRINNLKNGVRESIIKIKLSQVEKEISEVQNELKQAKSNEEVLNLFNRLNELNLQKKNYMT